MLVKIKVLANTPSVKYTCMAGIASGINFITLIIWGRVFSVEDYGIVTTFQAFVSNVSIFMIPLQVMMCTLLASEAKNENIENIIYIFKFINIVEFVLIIIVIEKVMQYLYLNTIIEVVLLICLIFLSNTHTVLTGVAQGKQDFLLLGKISILLFLIKLAVSVLLSISGMGPLAVNIGFVIAETVCVIYMLKKWMQLTKIFWKINKVQMDRDVMKQYVWTFVLYIVVSLYMNNGDLLLGNIYCSKSEIGLYSATIGLAKISVFLIATPIATIVLPKMVAAKGERRKQYKMLILAEIITLAGNLLYGICFYTFGGWFIPVIYGESYKRAEEYILPCIVFSIVLGMFWVFYQYILAAELTKKFAVITAITGALAIVWILMMKGELSNIPLTMTAAMVLAMICIAICRNRENGIYY